MKTATFRAGLLKPMAKVETIDVLVENLESWRRPTFWSRLLGRAR